MQYIRQLIHDAATVARTAWHQWRYIRRHLRQGGNPDMEAF